MFVYLNRADAASKVIATLLAAAVVMVTFGVQHFAQAASYVDVSDTLTDSNPSSLSGHLVSFELASGSSIGPGDTITLTFEAGFGGVATSVSGDLDVQVDSGGTIAIGGFSSDATSIAFNGVTATSAQVVTIEIADDVITNPAVVDSYEITVAANGDIGKTRVAIVPNVQVTAIVETVFDFTVTGVATTSNVNGTTTTGATTDVLVPFGILTAGEIKTLAQQLNVETNANTGYIVTVEQDQDLQSSNGAVIDSFTNGTYVDTPTAWAGPTGGLLLENEWGHWGITSTDSDLQGTDPDFGSDEWIAASTSPRVIMAHNGPSDGSTGTDEATADDVGQTIVGFQIEITSLQEAADDYNTTLTYIATPTF